MNAKDAGERDLRHLSNIKKSQKSNIKSMGKEKVYVLDTNILVHDPKSIFSFKGAHVIIPIVVLEELEQFKGEGTDRGRNTRQVIRYLDELREKGSLKNGIPLEDGGTLQVLFWKEQDLPEAPFFSAAMDNTIILSVLYLQQQNYDVRFISKDLNARVKADSLGIHSEDYKKEYVTEDEFYRGWIKIAVPAVELKREFPNSLYDIKKELSINQYILAESNHNSHNYRVYRYLGEKNFKPIYTPTLSWPFQPRNPQQLMALDLLLDESVQLVCLFGPAGTGKTFLALLAGLHQVLTKRTFEKMLISRPVVPLGRDIGFLPGTIQEKLHSWMLPIYDNMEFIIHSVNINQHFQGLKETHKESDKKGNRKKGRSNIKDSRYKRGSIMPIDELVHQGKVAMEAITYMRGRSIPYQYILIDEAQNLTPHEIKTLITRVGEGSKIILAGDPYQIDSPYLDFASNGLVIASERFKGNNLFGTVFLETSERSKLSQIAGKLL